MAILGRFTKQPGEVQDYDVSFVDWLAALTDTAVSHTVTVDAGLTLDSSVLTDGVVKAWLRGGTDGTSYKVTVTVVTAVGRTKEDEIVVKVKET